MLVIVVVIIWYKFKDLGVVKVDLKNVLLFNVEFMVESKVVFCCVVIFKIYLVK